MQRLWILIIVLAVIIAILGTLMAVVILQPQFPPVVITPSPTPATRPSPTQPLLPTSSPTPTTTRPTTPTPTPLTNLIRITNPVPNQIISSPLTITGQARGNWYFEATAPVRLVDANNNQLAQSFITAQGDWMTTNFVPFSGQITFSAPNTSTGTLILEKSNPSGLPENDQSISIPIRFR